MPRAVYDPERDRRYYQEQKLEQETQEAKEQEEYDVATKEAAPAGQAEPQQVNPLQAIPDTIQNLAQGAANLLGQGQAYQQKVQEAQSIQQERQAAFDKAQGPLGTVLSESVAVANEAVVGTVEDTLNTVDLLGDVVKKGARSVAGLKTPATEDPWSDRYISAAYSFGLRKPKTEVGQFAAKILKTAVIMRQIMTKAPQGLLGLGTKGKGLKGAVAEGIVPGVVADFITTTPEDGNFSAMVNSWIPEGNPLHDSFIFALRSEENDDPFTAKLKGSIEGGVVGAAADALLWLMWGRKAGQAVINAGGTREEALDAGVKAAKEKMDEVEKYNTKAIAKEGELFDEANADELMELLENERIYMERIEALKGANISDMDPQIRATQETLEDIRKNIAEVDERIANGYNPDDLRGIRVEDNAAFNKPAQPDLAIEQQTVRDMPAGKQDVPRSNEAYLPAEGGSYHMMTDAQYKIQAYKPAVEDLIRKYSSQFDLQRMAAKLKRPVAEIVQNAAATLDDFRNALNPDVPENTLIKMMESSGLIDPDVKPGVKRLSGEGILVTKALIGDTAEQIHHLATNAAASRGAGMPVGNQIDRMVDRLVTLLEFHKTTAYKSGFSLQMFKRRVGIADAGVEGEAAELTIKEVREWATKLKAAIRRGDAGADAEVQRLVNMMVLSGGDPTKQVKFIWAAAKLTGRETLTAFYQSMLSGPVTQMRNALGNTYSLVERPFSAYIRGVIKGDKAVQDSAITGFMAMTQGVGDAWKIAKQTYKTNTSVNFNTRFAVDDFEAQAMLKQLKMAATNPREEFAADFLNMIYRAQHNPWLSFPSRALMAGDDFFKSLAARYRVYSKAKYDTLQHMDPSANVDEVMDMFVKKYSQGIDLGTGRILDKDLLDYAERVTFQQDPGAMINALGNFVDKVPLVGRLYMPFVRTPGNLAGYGLEHLPLVNQGIRKFDAAYLAAKKNGDRMLMAELEGRSATGGLFMMGLTTLALTTDVTGNYPADPAERAAWRAEGRPPMSIKVGNKWVSYASLEPVNSFLAITADAVRLAKQGGADAASQILNQAKYSFIMSYTDKSFLSGLAEIGDMLNPSNLNDPSGLDSLLNMANNLVPYAGLRRAFANAADPYLRETRGELDRMLKQSAPGFGNDLPAVTSWVSGNKLLSAGGGFFNSISPIRIQDYNDNYVARQLTDLGIPSNNIVKTGKYGVQLEPRHREQLANILFKSGLPKRLEKIMKTKEWQDMAKAYKGRPFDVETFLDNDEDQPPHIKMIRREINKYKATALRKLERLDESYVMLIAEEKYRRLQGSRGDFSKPSIDTIRRYAGLN